MHLIGRYIAVRASLFFVIFYLPEILLLFCFMFSFFFFFCHFYLLCLSSGGSFYSIPKTAQIGNPSALPLFRFYAHVVVAVFVVSVFCARSAGLDRPFIPYGAPFWSANVLVHMCVFVCAYVSSFFVVFWFRFNDLFGRFFMYGFFCFIGDDACV